MTTTACVSRSCGSIYNRNRPNSVRGPNGPRILFLLGTLAISILARPAVAAPRATLIPAEFDFGRVQQGAKIAHTFTLHNGGDSPLTIERVEMSLPGMTCRFPHVVAPGTDAAIAVEWDTSRVQGKLRGQASLATDDPALSPARLDLSADVVGLFELSPLPEVFLSEFVGEDKSAELTLTVNGPRPVEIRLAGHGGTVDAALSPEEPGRSYRISVRAAGTAVPGRRDDSLVFSTNDPAHPRIEVPVHLLVKQDLYANPEDVDFGEVSLAAIQRDPRIFQLLAQNFFVKRRKGAFRLLRLWSDVAALDFRATPSAGANSSFQIGVNLRPESLRPGSLEGNIWAETDDPKFPRVSVRVHGRIVEH